MCFSEKTCGSKTPFRQLIYPMAMDLILYIQVCVPEDMLVRDVLDGILGDRPSFTTVRNKFGCELDVDLMLCTCLDDRDSVWVLDHGELWQFNFFIDGCSFVQKSPISSESLEKVAIEHLSEKTIENTLLYFFKKLVKARAFQVLLAPYKEIHDLLTEAEKVFKSLFKTKRWKYFRHVLHCQKHDHFWEVKRKKVANISYCTVFSIFSNKDTIYCFDEDGDVELPEVKFLVLYSHCKHQEYEQLHVVLQTVVQNMMLAIVKWNSAKWNWISFDRKVKNQGFYLKIVRPSKCSHSKLSKAFFEDKKSNKDSSYLDRKTELQRKKTARISLSSDVNASATSDNDQSISNTTPVTTSTPRKPDVLVVSSDSECNNEPSAAMDVTIEHSTTGYLSDVSPKKKRCYDTDGSIANTVKDWDKERRRSRSYLIKEKFFHRKRTSRFSQRFLTVSSWRRFNHLKSASLTKQDIDTLKPGRWVNDEIINYYLKLIASWSRVKNVYVFNTFFYTCLRKRGYTRVERWTKKVDIFQHDLVMFPIHLGDHWILVVADMPRKVITYYDSMKSSRHSPAGCQKVITDYLNKEQMTKHNNIIQTWSLKTCENIPVQQNSDDCGVFVCLYAKCLALGLPMNFTMQDNIRMVRRLMIKEICSGKLFAKIF